MHIRQRVEIDEMQCRFMSDHGGTTVAVFIFKPATEAAPDF